jgi:hypothetical protein
MFEKRPKFSFFILGMFFGALSGGVLVYYNSVITNENKISVNLIPQIVKQVIGVINNKNENTKDTLAIEINGVAKKDVENALTAESEENSAAYANQTDSNLILDTIANDSIKSLENESINIKTEELITAKEVIVYTLDFNTNNKFNKSDSLLAIVSGTKDEAKKGNNQKVMVELWKSPINYKGYQASKNKIILFGLAEIEAIKLISFKNNLLLKYNETVYYLDYNKDFRSYEKVNDTSILNQINKIFP